MQDKRQHVRFEKSFMTIFSIKDHPSKTHNISRLDDISKGGLRFFSKERYPNGTIIIFKLMFPHTYPEGTTVEGEVVSAVEANEGSVYKIGIKFINLTPKVISDLSKMEESILEVAPQDKRQHVRIESHHMITYHLDANKDNLHTIEWLMDISKGGLSFFSYDVFSIGTRIEFHVRFPFLHPQITFIKGRVVGVDEVFIEKTYKIRVQFMDLDFEAINALDQMERINLKNRQ